MYYRDNSQDYKEEINTESYDEHDDEYEDFFNYQMMPLYPMKWNMHKLNNFNRGYRCKGSENTVQSTPMMNIPVIEEEDGDLKMLYPKIYIRIYPTVKHHCDIMTSMYGTMYCPSKDEMDHICKEICDKYEEHYGDDEDDYDNYMRQRESRSRRNGVQNLIKILLIRELLGKRHYGEYWG
jgi:hypothetical protein